jgi:hypothetical protein
LFLREHVCGIKETIIGDNYIVSPWFLEYTKGVKHKLSSVTSGSVATEDKILEEAFLAAAKCSLCRIEKDYIQCHSNWLKSCIDEAISEA